MLLIDFLGIIAKLTSVSGHCHFGTHGMDDFDLTNVSISLFIRFMGQAADKNLFGFILLVLYFWFIKNQSIYHIRLCVLVN
jgi:hypothetical protein